MLGLYVLKSVDFIMHSAVLFTACGIMFNIPTALILNYIGAVIMITPFYFLGRHAGRPLLVSLTEKHEKLKVLTESGVKSKLLLAALLRSTGLSMHLVSLYLGASDTRYGDYLCGSLLGLTPMLIVYTVLGQSASDVSSPAFIVSATLGIVLPLASLVVYALIKRSLPKKYKSAISSKENVDYNRRIEAEKTSELKRYVEMYLVAFLCNLKQGRRGFEKINLIGDYAGIVVIRNYDSEYRFEVIRNANDYSITYSFSQEKDSSVAESAPTPNSDKALSTDRLADQILEMYEDEKIKQFRSELIGMALPNNEKSKFPLDRIKLVATDGPAHYLSALIDNMDSETFSKWMEYHFATCERQDLIGASNHTLDILQVRG